MTAAGAGESQRKRRPPHREPRTSASDPLHLTPQHRLLRSLSQNIRYVFQVRSSISPLLVVVSQLAALCGSYRVGDGEGLLNDHIAVIIC